MPLSLRPLLDELTIKTTALQYRKLDLDYIDPDPTIGDWGWAQRPYIATIEEQYNAGRPVRIIVLKARQLGISTATEAVLFLWGFLHPGSNALVVAHQDGPAQNLFGITSTYWQRWPHRALFTEKYSTRRQLRWQETESQVQVATARNAEKARSSTLHAVHGSEVAFWEDAETLWTGMNQSIPTRHGTFVCLESTANGVGNWYHEAWQMAEAGESEFIPLFFPWYKHSACRVYSNSLHTVDLDAEEKEILGRMRIDHIDEEDCFASLAFRRWAVPNKVTSMEKFHQEYPTTAEEAFITSGNPVFSAKAINECYEQKHGAVGRLYRDGRGEVVFEPDPSGRIRIFKQPHSDPRPDRYFVSGDPSRTITGDPACAQVIHRKTLEQMAVWHGHCDPVTFAREMMLLGDFFGHAMLCPEAEGGGQATVGAIMQAGYGNVWSWKKPDRTTASTSTWGWATNYSTKHWAIGNLQKLLLNREILLHDRETINELLNYVELPGGELGNAGRRNHDDTVMALAIAYTASMREGHYSPQKLQSYSPDIFTSELEADIVNLATRRINNERSA